MTLENVIDLQSILDDTLRCLKAFQSKVEILELIMVFLDQVVSSKASNLSSAETICPSHGAGFAIARECVPEVQELKLGKVDSFINSCASR